MNEKKYTKQRLKDYALWYYFRYYPSNNRLKQKLHEKGTVEDAQTVLSEIDHLLLENQIIASKIDNYIFRNKNYRYIRQKMREKLFVSQSVEKYLEKYENSGESLLNEEFLRRKIEGYIQKGKSQQYIAQALGETKNDKEKLSPILEEYFCKGELENIKKAYDKIVSRSSKVDINSFEGKQKITQKLLSQGFRYDEIKNALQ